MDPIQNKKNILKKLQPAVYLIHGIFDFKNKKLVYVSLDPEEVDLKFDLENYDDNYDLIEINIALG